MTRRLRLFLAVCLCGVLFGGVLFSDYWISMSGPTWLRSIAVEVRAVCQNPVAQWKAFLYLEFISARLPVRLPNYGAQVWGVSDADLWLSMYLLIVALLIPVSK